MKQFYLPPGFHAELVAGEPLIQDPIAIDWDPDGRMWVVENIRNTGYMLVRALSTVRRRWQQRPERGMRDARPSLATFLGSAINLLEERPPPDHDMDVARPRRRRPVDEVHALPVWRHVVLRAPVSRSDERDAQRVGDTECQLPARLALHRPATKTAFKIDVEKLLPIAPPDGLAAAVAGHHETPRWTRHRADGDHRPASLLRHVGEPLSVRRYPRVVLGERPGKNRLGRLAGLERHAPHISEHHS